VRTPSALITHIVVYVAVNAFLVAMWVIALGGSTAKLQNVLDDPTTAMSQGFWPIWPILGWGMLLVIHAGITIVDLVLGGKARRRRKRLRKQAARAGTNVIREVGTVIDKAQTRRMERDHRRRERTPTPRRRWVTVMFSDISDSTKHNEAVGDEEWHRILGRVRGLVRTAVSSRGGHEVGTAGDGLLARFESPADAVLCGIDIQGELRKVRLNEEAFPEVRIGVHAGEAVEEEGDLVGRVINLASRVTDEASPGEILVTEPVADQLVGKLELEDKGLRPLKGLAQPRHLLAVKWSDD
jgi:class 3 adenylate cyclase